MQLATLAPEDEIIKKRWFAHRNLITQIADTQLHGKISIRYGIKRLSFNLYWKCQPQQTYFYLHIPTGQRVLEFSSTPEQTWIKDSSRKISESKQADDLLAKHLGFRLSINDLCYWSKGMINPESNVFAVRFNNAGRLETFTQSRWKVHYKSYIPVANIFLPQKITLNKNNIEIVLFANRWQFTLES